LIQVREHAQKYDLLLFRRNREGPRVFNSQEIWNSLPARRYLHCRSNIAIYCCDLLLRVAGIAFKPPEYCIQPVVAWMTETLS